MFEGELNMYVIAGDPLTVVDTGIGTPEALAAMEAGLAARGLAIEDIRRVVLTHKHADHIGLAREIHDRSGATVYVHEDDWEGVADLDKRHGEFVPLVVGKLREFQVPGEVIAELQKFLGHGKRFAHEVPAEKLRDGQTLDVDGRELEVIHTPGHTQGSICLRYGNHLFSGDHVLPTISPNIGAGELRRRGMMHRFLDSLDRIAAYDSPEIVVLPGHGGPFSNLAERLRRVAGASRPARAGDSRRAPRRRAEDGVRSRQGPVAQAARLPHRAGHLGSQCPPGKGGRRRQRPPAGRPLQRILKRLTARSLRGRLAPRPGTSGLAA